MSVHVLIHNEVVHDVAESELAPTGPLTQTLTDPLQYASGYLEVEPKPSNYDFLVQLCACQLRIRTADALIPSQEFMSRAPGVPLLCQDPCRAWRGRAGLRSDRPGADRIRSRELNRAGAG